MRLLWVGDPHAEPHDLSDCGALTGYVLQVAEETRPDYVVLAGDLYHTHAVIHAEVQYFWWDFFEALRARKQACVLLKGNHDAPTHDTRATALVAHVEQCVTVLWGPKVIGGAMFCPYTTGRQLVEWNNNFAHNTGTLFCHQTFDGSVYENGFFAGDGVDPNLIAQKQIVSGHIHTPQAFGKVWYPGAPRWRTLSDANVARAIWLLDLDEQGRLVRKTPYDTGGVCRVIHHVEDTPFMPIDLPVLEQVIPKKDLVYVRVCGPRDWLLARKPLFEAAGCRVKTVRTDTGAAVRVRESEGVGVAFGKWLEAFEPRHNTPKPKLKEMVAERFHGF